MRYTKLIGLSKIEIEVSLIFSYMNLKKLANWIWKDTFNNLRLTPIFSILSLKIFIKNKIAILCKLKWLFCLQSERLIRVSYFLWNYIFKYKVM